jgi:hypothetical protein
LVDRLPLGARIAFDGRLAATGLAGAAVLGVVIMVPIAWFNLRSHLENAPDRNPAPARSVAPLSAFAKD